VKQLTTEEEAKIIEHLDAIFSITDTMTVTEMLDVIKKQLGSVNEKDFLEIIGATIKATIVSSYQQVGAELKDVMNNPGKIATLKERLSERSEG
jgi:hypothetical protein